MAAIASAKTPKIEIPYGFYKIDRAYLEHLQKFDRKVPNSDYEDYGRNEKFYLGPVTNKNGVDFFVPITSKTGQSPGRLQFDREGKLGSLDFKYMVPCVGNFLTPHEPTHDKRANIQWDVCSKCQTHIQDSGDKVYKNVVNFGELQSNRELVHASCKFDKNIKVMWEYFEKVIGDRIKAKAPPIFTQRNKAVAVANPANLPPAAAAITANANQHNNITSVTKNSVYEYG